MRYLITQSQYQTILEQNSDKPKRKRRSSEEIEKERLEWEEGYMKRREEVKNKLQKAIDEEIIPFFNSESWRIKIISSEIQDIALNVGPNIANIYPKIVFTAIDDEMAEYFRKNGFFPYIVLDPFYSLLRRKLFDVFNRRVGVSQERINYEYIP
jgi:hypothetical protein